MNNNIVHDKNKDQNEKKIDNNEYCTKEKTIYNENEKETKKIINDVYDEKSIFNSSDNKIKFSYQLKAKLEICIYSEKNNIKNTWKIMKYFENKYLTLRESRIKSWIKLGSVHFETQIKSNGANVKKIRKQKGQFEIIESKLVEEVTQRGKNGLIRDMEWARKRAQELHEQYKDEFELNDFSVSA